MIECASADFRGIGNHMFTDLSHLWLQLAGMAFETNSNLLCPYAKQLDFRQVEHKVVSLLFLIIPCKVKMRPAGVHLVVVFVFPKLRVYLDCKVEQCPVLASLPYMAMLTTTNVDFQAARESTFYRGNLFGTIRSSR